METSKAPMFNSFSLPLNHQPPRLQNARPHNSIITMPRPDLTLKHINNTIVIPCPRFRFLGSLRVVKSMAATAENAPTERGEDDRVEKTETKLTSPPPPPERPLPGDCCGSGCVRCVWDVYYEELEAYNNLWRKSDDDKSKSNSNSSSKSREE